MHTFTICFFPYSITIIPYLLYLQDGRSLFYAVVRSGHIDLVKWFAKEYNPPLTVTKVCLTCLFKMPTAVYIYVCCDTVLVSLHIPPIFLRMEVVCSSLLLSQGV